MVTRNPVGWVTRALAAIAFAFVVVASGLPARCLMPSHCERCLPSDTAISGAPCTNVAPGTARMPAADSSHAAVAPAAVALAAFALPEMPRIAHAESGEPPRLDHGPPRGGGLPLRI